MFLHAFISHRHSVICKKASHAASAIVDVERTTVVFVGTACAGIKLVMGA